MESGLEYLSIAEASRLIHARKLSPVEYTNALLARIQALEPQLNSFITLTPDLAVWQAKRAEDELAKGEDRGPLHGIPFALKDIYNTKGTLTTGGSKIAIDNVPAEDAATSSPSCSRG